MRIIETCPECGADIVTVMVATYPPKETKRCLQCGWFWEEGDEDVVRIPFVPPEKKRETITPHNPYPYPADLNYSFGEIPDCCRGCSNHPSNGGSGICACTLPYITNTRTVPNTKRGTVTTNTYTIPSDNNVITTDHIIEEGE